MTRKTSINKHLAYWNDFLCSSLFEDTKNFADSSEFHPVDVSNNLWDSLAASPTQTTKSIVWTFDKSHVEILNSFGQIQTFPTNSVLDKVLAKIVATAYRSPSFIPINEVGGIIASIFSYPSGSFLKWHSDSAHYLGAFTLYLHSQWDDNWGGLLLYWENKRKLEGGFIQPLPNRLVLVKTPLAHSISPILSPVEVNRISLTGFFVKREWANQQMNEFMENK